MKTLSGYELQEIFNNLGISYSAVTLTDSKYTLPSFSWISRTFKKRIYNLLKTEKILEYAKNRNDCEDLAFIAYGEIRKLNAKTLKKRKINAGISACVLFYNRDVDQVNHAVIGFLTLHRDKYKLIIIDRKIWKNKISLEAKELSETELNSCSFCVV